MKDILLEYGFQNVSQVLSIIQICISAITLDGTLYPSPNQKLNLTCNATGPVAPESIDWFHNGNLIDERKPQWQERVVILNYVPEVPGQSLISQLTINGVKATDAGVYVCRSMTPSLDTSVKTTSVMVNVLNGMYGMCIVFKNSKFSLRKYTSVSTKYDYNHYRHKLMA